MWVRGLKQMLLLRSVLKIRSHPMWVRGLKQKKNIDNNVENGVAPYVGAWIETRPVP